MQTPPHRKTIKHLRSLRPRDDAAVSILRATEQLTKTDCGVTVGRNIKEFMLVLVRTLRESFLVWEQAIFLLRRFLDRIKERIQSLGEKAEEREEGSKDRVIRKMIGKIDLKLKAAICVFVASKTVGNQPKIALSLMEQLLRYRYPLRVLRREECELLAALNFENLAIETDCLSDRMRLIMMAHLEKIDNEHVMKEIEKELQNWALFLNLKQELFELDFEKLAAGGVCTLIEFLTKSKHNEMAYESIAQITHIEEPELEKIRKRIMLVLFGDNMLSELSGGTPMKSAQEKKTKRRTEKKKMIDSPKRDLQERKRDRTPKRVTEAKTRGRTPKRHAEKKKKRDDTPMRRTEIKRRDRTPKTPTEVMKRDNAAQKK